jgi:hypothetical protein
MRTHLKWLSWAILDTSKNQYPPASFDCITFHHFPHQIPRPKMPPRPNRENKNMSADSASLATAAGLSRATTRNRFFLGMTLVMGAIVLIGFTPTLYGRAAFNVPKMPGYLYLHGAVLTAWYALLVVQATLVGNRNLALHRTLGWAALAFLVLIPVAGMGTQLALPDRLRELGALDAMKEMIQTIFWLNTFATLQFVGFVGAAIWLRKSGDAHKRLMLFAGIAIISPAAARLSRWPLFGNAAPDLGQPASTGNEVVFALGATVLLVAAIIVNDLYTKRRLHGATMIGTAVLIGMSLIVPLFANSDWGKAIVWAVS